MEVGGGPEKKKEQISRWSTAANIKAYLPYGPLYSTRSTFWVQHKLSNVQEPFLGVHSIHAGERHGAEGN